ncbi:MAG: hypothetical protein K2H23_08750 [Oscillospiraceae bacterium]|nr:hypothetical protein [Oscillospiraceae bacterium]
MRKINAGVIFVSIELFEHNQIAYESAVAMLAETGKAAVIHPTGTGKSFIGFKFCEDNLDKTVCWLFPSDYIFRTQLENLKKTGAEIPQNIKFYTYAKLSYMSDTELEEIDSDAVILDEFHRGGASIWQKNLAKFLDMYAEVPILGMSAANVRYLDNQRDMVDEFFDGNIASEMTLGEAIVRGILKGSIVRFYGLLISERSGKIYKNVQNAEIQGGSGYNRKVP